jgi:NAD(P)-dependent dehydrogenase (short-subunit alcohol dehydrogenase family)
MRRLQRTKVRAQNHGTGRTVQIDLSGKVIFITGAMGAIAECMVKKLNAAGAMLVLVDLKPANEARKTLTRWRIPDECYVYHSCDITDSASLSRIVDESFGRFPGMDTVLGHAGGCGLHPFATTSEAEFEGIFRFNFLSQVSLTRQVFAQWSKRNTAGHIIFTSSYVARVPHTQIPAYASAKAALENFARCMALEYAAAGIRVNVVSPGNVAAGSSLKVFDEDPAYRDFVLRVSLGRRNSPESVADAFVFLCSPLAAEISGQILSADYGSGIGNRL